MWGALGFGFDCSAESYTTDSVIFNSFWVSTQSESCEENNIHFAADPSIIVSLNRTHLTHRAEVDTERVIAANMELHCVEQCAKSSLEHNKYKTFYTH